MVHVTCDLCGKELRQSEDLHYVVKMEVFVVGDPDRLTDDDMDEDNLEAVSEILHDQEIDEMIDSELESSGCTSLRYDLCCHCQKKFVKDPLKREVEHSYDFSAN
jgi:hypothetical protein